MDKQIVKSEKELNNYSEYKKLSDYNRYCLVANNYWVIMNGEHNKFVCVPTSDLHFWYYFNENCFIDCVAFQRRKKVELDELNNKKELIIQDKKIEKEIKTDLIIEPEITSEPVKEQIVKITPNVEDMPIEENHNFLKEKQEHPVYEKRNIVSEELKNANAVKQAQIENDKKTKKTKKGKNDDQPSLF